MTENKISFPCTCSGCMGYKKDYERASLKAVLAEIEPEGAHYFSPATCRFFGYRATGFTNLFDGRVIIQGTQKAGFEEELGRVKKLTLFCPYGHVVTDAEYPTVRQAQKNLLSFYQGVECQCHGCQIDRAGRN